MTPEVQNLIANQIAVSTKITDFLEANVDKLIEGEPDEAVRQGIFAEIINRRKQEAFYADLLAVGRGEKPYDSLFK